jgi:transposase-like protein
MEKIPNAIYTRELREEAVKLVTEGGLTIPEVGRKLSIAPSTLRYWVKADEKGKLREVGKDRKALTEIERELARVKRELAIVKMERDILKKRPRTLPRSRCPVRDHERDAAHKRYLEDMPSHRRLTKRILPMAQS